MHRWLCVYISLLDTYIAYILNFVTGTKLRLILCIYLLVLCSEGALYGNIILKKGALPPE